MGNFPSQFMIFPMDFPMRHAWSMVYFKIWIFPCGNLAHGFPNPKGLEFYWPGKPKFARL
jgi:hypothetical protein